MKKNYIFLGSVIAFMALFYKQCLGVNLFIFNVLLLSGCFACLSNIRKNKNVWILAIGALITSASAAWYADFSSIFLNIITLLALPVFLHQEKGTMLFVGTVGIWNMISAPVRIFRERHWDKEDTTKNLLFKRILLYGVLPFVVLIFFIYLYRFVNPVWGDYIWKFIESILSWTFIFLLILATVLMYGFWYFIKGSLSGIAIFAVNRRNSLEPTGKPTFKNISLSMEMGSGVLMFALLNLLLFSLLATDFQQLFIEKQIPEGYTLSEYLHKGVYAVIISIVFAIGLLVFYFKGAFNFHKNSKPLRILAWVWIVLNVILVLFTLYKNMLYVEVYDLTFKRVSVFIYLLLCWVGLYFTGVKLKKKKTFVYIVRKMYWAFYIMWVLTTPINWTNFMTEYNLNSAKEKDFKSNSTDLDYLLCEYKSLDELNIEALEEFLRENPENRYAERIQKGIDEKLMTVLESDNKRKWRGKRLYDWYIKRHLKSVGYKPKYAEISNGVFFSELESVQVLDYNLGYNFEKEELNKYLKNLQKYKNVTNLTLEGRSEELKSLEFLDNLAQLKTLNAKDFFGSNDFELKGCPQLQNLYLRYNSSSFLKIGSSYPNLTELNITSRSIEQLDGFENVSNLKVLSVGLTEKAEIDITPLKELESLWLDGISKCEIADNLPTLKTLSLNRILVSFSDITEFPNLENLYYNNTKASYLKGIGKFSRLKFLDVSSNHLVSVEELKGLDNLEELNLRSNHLTDISALKELQNLKSLDVVSNPVNNISVVYELPNLEKLNARKSLVVDLDLNRLPKNIVIPNHPKFQKQEEVETATALPEKSF